MLKQEDSLAKTVHSGSLKRANASWSAVRLSATRYVLNLPKLAVHSWRPPMRAGSVLSITLALKKGEEPAATGSS